MNIESPSQERYGRRKFGKNLGILTLATALGITLHHAPQAQAFEEPPKPLIFIPGVGGSHTESWKRQTQRVLDPYGIELITPEFPAYSDKNPPVLPIYLEKINDSISASGWDQVDVAGFSLGGGGLEMYLALGYEPTTIYGEKKIRNFISISARNLYNLNRSRVPEYLLNFYQDLNDPLEVERKIAGKIIVAGCFGDASIPRDNAYGLALAHRVEPVLRTGGHESIVSNPQEFLTVVRS